jgi:hypothetical protein
MLAGSACYIRCLSITPERHRFMPFADRRGAGRSLDIPFWCIPIISPMM